MLIFYAADLAMHLISTSKLNVRKAASA